jgi:protein O-GlcNAc transferase
MKPGRNDPCPCGSGKKYKQCCGREGAPQTVSVNLPQLLQSAIAAHQSGQLHQAEALYRQVLQADAKNFNALHLLGLIATENGQLDAAVDLIGRAVAVKPNAAPAQHNLGIALQALGRLQDAAGSFQRAAKLQPDFIEAQMHLGGVLVELGRLEEAATSFRRAVAIAPNLAGAYNNLGIVCRTLGRLDEAVASFQRACALQPDYAEALNNLGNALDEQGRSQEAVDCYRRALLLQPEYAEALNNLGATLKGQGKLVEAVAAFQRALAIRPDYVSAHVNLGGAFNEMGRLDEASACFRRAMEIKPDHAAAHSSWLFLRNYVAGYDLAALYADHLEWARRHAEALTALAAPHDNDADPARRLRIGYVSGDLCSHSVANFIEPVLARHDRRRFEVTCYSNSPRVDEVTRRLQGYADHWRRIVGMSDAAAEAMIRADRIDILVDLSGHTADNRLPLFARKPAPLQATWIGYPNTTGMSAMDYRISDANLDPPGMTERYHTEALVRLPASACFQPAAESPEVNDVPALTAGHVTFACFNNFTKVTDEAIGCWAQVLEAVPGSRLMLLIGDAGNAAARERVEQTFARHGVKPERLQLIGKRPLAEYLALHHGVDIALDPFPYNGGTTSVHSLWMGVPIITLAGQSPVSRVGVTILANVGLQELIAQSVAEYVAIARDLARDTERLCRIRAELRGRLQASPLIDAERLTRALEDAYRNMWQTWCTKQSDEARTQ